MHAFHSEGQAKIWLEPQIEVAENLGLPPHLLTTALRLVHEHEHEIRAAWKEHFKP